MNDYVVFSKYDHANDPYPEWVVEFDGDWVASFAYESDARLFIKIKKLEAILTA